MSNKKDLFAPTIVLVCICLVASVLLAATYQITKPIIEKINIENANKSRSEVIEAANSFTEVTDVDLVNGVTEVYEADCGGYVITSSAKGFGGAIVVMTGIDADGNIIKIKVTDASNETPGLGSKTTLPDHAAKFVGAKSITMDKDAATGDVTYTAPVTGATYSSKGVFNAVSAALEQFEKIGGAF